MSNVVFQLVMSRVLCVVCLSEDTNELKNEVNEMNALSDCCFETNETNTNTQTTKKRERLNFLVCLASPCLDFFLP